VILTGWKEIAKHLRYGVRTLQRWESKGLPVKHVNDGPRSPVVADSDELDAWILHRTHIPSGVPKSLLDNVRRAQEIKLNVERNVKEFRQRVENFRKGMADFRAKKQALKLKRDSSGIR
jgi:hypothetical protein